MLKAIVISGVVLLSACGNANSPSDHVSKEPVQQDQGTDTTPPPQEPIVITVPPCGEPWYPPCPNPQPKPPSYWCDDHGCYSL